MQRSESGDGCGGGGGQLIEVGVHLAAGVLAVGDQIKLGAPLSTRRHHGWSRTGARATLADTCGRAVWGPALPSAATSGTPARSATSSLPPAPSPGRPTSLHRATATSAVAWRARPPCPRACCPASPCLCPMHIGSTAKLSQPRRQSRRGSSAARSHLAGCRASGAAAITRML